MTSEKPVPKVQRIASYALITSEDHVLLSLLNRGPNRGKWTLVGGGVEHGESPKDAVIREVQEESGIILEEIPPVWDVFSHHYSFEEANGEKKNMHFIGIVF